MKPDEIAAGLNDAERDGLLGRFACDATGDKLRALGLWDSDGSVTPLGRWVRQSIRVREWRVG